ncbi:hypothetical protein AGMMS49975_23440 [Clostridia bacterium]|nr:hypothetical protein AGMMS49975_23440 [Clostridia bacterium]
MKNGKRHLIIGTAICAATMLLFLAFSSRLPENVPIQITIDGSAENTLPKPLFVFGMPVAFAVVNLIRGLSLSRKENATAYSFYIVPGIAILLSILTLVTALHM